MCKEDVRIARVANAKQPQGSILGLSGQKVMPANPNRYALSMAVTFSTTAAAMPCVMFWANVGGQRWPLAVLGVDQMCSIVNIQEAGQAVCGEVWMEAVGDFGPTAVYIAEAAWDQSLESI